MSWLSRLSRELRDRFVPGIHEARTIGDLQTALRDLPDER